MANFDLTVLLLAKDMASKTIGKVKREVGTLGKVGAQASRGMSVLGATVAGGAAVAAAGLVKSIDAAADFESALNTINTVAQATPAQLKGIGDSIRAIARESGASLDDLTAAYYDLVSAGVSAADAQGVLKAATTLAVGGLATTAETVDLLTTAINSYGASASEAATISDYFAQAIAAGKVTASELAQSFAQVGPIAASSKIEIQELAAGYAQMTAKGIPAAEAATYMKSAILSLTRTTPPLEKLQKQTKRNYLALAGTKGLAYAFEVLRKDAKKAGVPLIELVGRQEALQYALSVTGTEYASYSKNLNAVEKAEGTAAAQMQERQKGLNFQLDKLRANLRDAAITIGSELLPAITPLAARFNEFLGRDSTRRGIADFAKGLAAAFEDIATFVQRVPWSQVGDSLRIAGLGARALLSAFTSMPSWVQGAVLTGWGLNKLTGGALTGIVGELGKGLIKGVLGMTAGVVHLKAGTVIGGPGGGAAPVGGAAGKLGGVANAVMKVAVVGIAAGVAVELGRQLGEQSTQLRGESIGVQNQARVFAQQASPTELVNAINAIDDQLRNPLNDLALQITNPLNGVRDRLIETKQELRAKLDQLSASNAAGDERTGARIGSLTEATRSTRTTIANGFAVNSAKITTVGMAARGTTAAIRAKNWSPRITVPVTVNTRVSVRATENAVAIQHRYTKVKT